MNDQLCEGCGRLSFLLNKNNLCVSCVFSFGVDPDESKIFRETGGELTIPDTNLDTSFSRIFGGMKPFCRKCDKMVDLFGPIYLIEHPCTRIYFTKCHGEIEVQMFNELLMKDYGIVDHENVFDKFSIIIKEKQET